MSSDASDRTGAGGSSVGAFSHANTQPHTRPGIEVDPDLGMLDPADDTARAPLRSWLEFQMQLGLDPRAALAALRRWRDPALALRARAPELRLPRASLDDSIGVLVREGIVALPLLASAYPDRLRVLTDPAPLLLVGGGAARDPELFERPAVSIVGARAASAYGLRVARELARDLAEAGVVVVSGLARGIDGAAHEGALEVDGLTVAIQACGPDIVYPRQHRGLARRIRERGLVMTEMPPGTPPRGPFFPLRNRLIAALSRVVVVVEARHRSGSLVTARHALDQGGDVMAVPGPVDAATSQGPNALLRDGAPPVLDAGDVLRWLGIEAAARAAVAQRAIESPRLGSDARRLAKSLEREPATADVLCRRLGWAAQRLSPALLELELEGVAAQDRDGRIRLGVAPRPPG